MGKMVARAAQNLPLSLQDFVNDHFEPNKRPRVEMVKNPGTA